MTSQQPTFRSLAPWLYLPAAIGLGGIVLVSLVTDVPLSTFTRDPAAVLGGHPFTGFLSNVGVLLWCATAAICGFTASLLGPGRGRADRATLIALGAALSTLLLVDDLFMLHDFILSRSLGLNERLVLLVYGVTVTGSLWTLRTALAVTHFGLLVVASSFFALSLGVDQLPEGLLTQHYLFEDGSKFLGIVGWFGFFVSVCWGELRKTVRAM